MLGWLAIGGAAAFDHAHAGLGTVLAGAVGPTGVDYGALASRRQALGTYLQGLAEVDVSPLSREQKLALYVNAYNGWTLATMLDEGPPASIRDLDGGKVWDTRHFRVGGEVLTLNQLENDKVRPLGDARVHAVLNCASKGCPPLSPAPLDAARADAQLTEAAQRWAGANAYRIDGDKLLLSHVFEWYGADFVREGKGDLPGLDGAAENAVWFLSRFLPAAEVERLKAGNLTAGWQDYDWSLNRRP